MDIIDVLPAHGLTKRVKKVSVVHGFAVDETNSNPYDAVTYIEASKNFTPATVSSGQLIADEWLATYPFNSIRVIGLQGGTVLGEIDSNDYTKFIDGSSVSEDVDVMIEIPPLYWKFSQTDVGYEVRWSSEQIDDTYKALAHSRGTILKGNLYIGAYEGYVLSSKLCSISDYTPASNLKYNNYITYAEAKGDGYQIQSYYATMLLQILFVSMFKTLNAELICTGRTGGTVGNSGLLNTNGLYYLPSSSSEGFKFMGIENLWGNKGTYIGGIYVSSSTEILINDGTVSDKLYTAFPISIEGVFEDSAHYPTKVIGTTEGGFLSISSIVGTSSTYYCDRQRFTPSYPFFNFGSTTSNYTGIFNLDAYYGYNESSSGISSRLIYLAP